MPSIKDGGRFSAYTTSGCLAPEVVTETEQSSQSMLFHLIKLQLPPAIQDIMHSSGSEYLHLVDSNYDVRFNNVVYNRFPLKFSPPSISSDGSIDNATIAIANVTREVMYWVERGEGLKNMRVHVKTVFSKFLDHKYTTHPDGTVTPSYLYTGEVDTSNIPAGVSYNNPYANVYAVSAHDEFYIDNYTANEQIVSFQLLPVIDLEIKLPRRRYVQDSCYWIFKDPATCKYSGGDSTCTKNFDACKKKLNQENFGGFPGISANRRIFL